MTNFERMLFFSLVGGLLMAVYIHFLRGPAAVHLCDGYRFCDPPVAIVFFAGMTFVAFLVLWFEDILPFVEFDAVILQTLIAPLLAVGAIAIAALSFTGEAWNQIGEKKVYLSLTFVGFSVLYLLAGIALLFLVAFQQTPKVLKLAALGIYVFGFSFYLSFAWTVVRKLRPESAFKDVSEMASFFEIDPDFFWLPRIVYSYATGAAGGLVVGVILAVVMLGIVSWWRGARASPQTPAVAAKPD